jgi:hypothetical protein
VRREELNCKSNEGDLAKGLGEAEERILIFEQSDKFAT